MFGGGGGGCAPDQNRCASGAVAHPCRGALRDGAHLGGRGRPASTHASQLADSTVDAPCACTPVHTHTHTHAAVHDGGPTQLLCTALHCPRSVTLATFLHMELLDGVALSSVFPRCDLRQLMWNASKESMQSWWGDTAWIRAPNSVETVDQLLCVMLHRQCTNFLSVLLHPGVGHTHSTCLHSRKPTSKARRCVLMRSPAYCFSCCTSLVASPRGSFVAASCFPSGSGSFSLQSTKSAKLL